MIHFDVQLIGGMVLHSGRIAEMATGEGKTLVATLPLYLNALTGRGAHLVTVNDYLARRDAEWMGELYRFLGLTCGCIQHDQSPDVRREQYACDITYGINSELGFDYLRDNGMATSREQQVQRGYIFAIVDEVDSILIDEARTYRSSSPVPRRFPRTSTTSSSPASSNSCASKTCFAAGLVNEAKSLLDDGKSEEAGVILYKVKLGQPRNKSLLRLLEDPVNRKALDKAELSFHAATRARTSFSRSRKNCFSPSTSAPRKPTLSEQGRDFLNPDEPEAFVLPDLMTAFRGDRHPYGHRRRRQGTRPRRGLQAHMRPPGGAHPQYFPACCARTACTNATWNTSSRKTRSSSSIRAPAARCRAAVGAMVSTRRSKPRKACRSTGKRRPWPRSRSRTISGCTRSSRA